MATPVRPPLRGARLRIFDSARWAGYQPRPDDIVIATYPKCGATDFAAYRAKVAQAFTPGLAAWLEGGRLVAGDSALSAD